MTRNSISQPDLRCKTRQQNLFLVRVVFFFKRLLLSTLLGGLSKYGYSLCNGLDIPPLVEIQLGYFLSFLGCFTIFVVIQSSESLFLQDWVSFDVDCPWKKNASCFDE